MLWCSVHSKSMRNALTFCCIYSQKWRFVWTTRRKVWRLCGLWRSFRAPWSRWENCIRYEMNSDQWNFFMLFWQIFFLLSTLFFFSKQQRDNDSVSGESGDEVDPFNDPDDKWEKDFKLDSSSSRFVRHKWIINWQVNPSSSCTWVIYCQLSISLVRPRDCIFLHRRISSLSSSGLSSSRARSSSAGKPQGTSWNTH